MDASVYWHHDIWGIWICVTAERRIYGWYGWQRGTVYGSWSGIYIWICGCGCGIDYIWHWRICECDGWSVI